jgi:hypothetical protein
VEEAILEQVGVVLWRLTVRFLLPGCNDYDGVFRNRPHCQGTHSHEIPWHEVLHEDSVALTGWLRRESVE